MTSESASPTESKDTTPGPCTCLERLQTELAEHNTYIDTALWETLSTGERRITVKVPTRKIDSRSRRRALVVAPHYCCFCGEPYRPEAPVRGPRTAEPRTTGDGEVGP